MSRDSKKKNEIAQADTTTSSEPRAISEESRVETLQAADLGLQAYAEQAESLEEAANLPAVSELSEAQAAAMEPALQAFWMAVLPLVGTHASRPGEFPGVVKVEPGDEEDEAIVYLDVPTKPYRRGQRGDMDRVLALSVKLDHDYRRLGDQYYCIDCESPSDETRH